MISTMNEALNTYPPWPMHWIPTMNSISVSNENNLLNTLQRIKHWIPAMANALNSHHDYTTEYPSWPCTENPPWIKYCCIHQEECIEWPPWSTEYPPRLKHRVATMTKIQSTHDRERTEYPPRPMPWIPTNKQSNLALF